MIDDIHYVFMLPILVHMICPMVCGIPSYINFSPVITLCTAFSKHQSQTERNRKLLNHCSCGLWYSTHEQLVLWFVVSLHKQTIGHGLWYSFTNAHTHIHTHKHTRLHD